MNKKLLLMLVLSGVMTATVIPQSMAETMDTAVVENEAPAEEAMTDEAIMEQCQNNAKEDGIEAADMDQYIGTCFNEYKQEAAGDSQAADVNEAEQSESTDK